MTPRSAFVSLLALTLLGLAWHHASPPAVPPGQVENQVRTFGPQVAQKLAPTAVFARTEQQIAGVKLTGYRPQPELPHAPPGLLPAEQQAWLAMARRVAINPALTPFFPERYSQGTAVRGEGMSIVLKPLGSAAAPAQIENGKLVYHNAYPATDSLQVVNDGGTEEFLLLHDPSAPRRFEYEITAASGVSDVTLRNNVIHFKNLKGQELEIAAPYLLGSPHPASPQPQTPLPSPRSQTPFGNAIVGAIPSPSPPSPAIHWELIPTPHAWPRLALVINDPRQLHYPVLIDPSWVAPLGQLNTARAFHTATLLNNGQVLVVGGQGATSLLASAELYNPATGTWTVTGSVTTARLLHTATLLANGKVLVVGGYNNGLPNPVNTEIYDPSTGKWTATGNLHASRYSHTATLLPNGQVLVAGGYDNNNNSIASAELYNPATGTWILTGSLNGARGEATATLLPNGQVLAAGGYDSTNSETLNTAELFNPATGTWTTTGTLITDRDQGTATLLQNGQVLLAGGYSSNAVGDDTNLAELYHPTTGTWTATGSMTTVRKQQTAIFLPSGQVLAAGGYNLTQNTLGSTETYNPTTGTWTAQSSLIDARVYDTATLLPSGQVLLAGGGIADPTDDANVTSVFSSSELYDPGVGTWSATGSMNTARRNFTATLLLSGQVLVAGGLDSLPPPFIGIDSAELYNPTSGVWTATGKLNFGRGLHTATLLPNGLVLVAGGFGSTGSILSSAELYNPSTGTWAVTGNLNVGRFWDTATLLANGQVLVAGGQGTGGNLVSTELYNATKGTWTLSGNLTVNRNFDTATLLPDGGVLFVGGLSGISGLASTEIYDPATGKSTLTGSLNTGRYSATATLLPSGQVLVVGGSSGKDISGPNVSDIPIATSELYNPAVGTWTLTGPLNTARELQTATLLPSGEVLVAEGYGVSGSLTTAELYHSATGSWTATGNLASVQGGAQTVLLADGRPLLVGGFDASGVTLATSELFSPGLGFTSATQPVVNPLSTTGTFSLPAGTDLTVTGTGFTGVSEAYGGTTQSAPGNAPVVQIESLGNEQTISLLANPDTDFTPTKFVSREVTGLNPGPALLTLIVNGTPSASQYLVFTKKAQTITFPSPGSVVYNQKVTLKATASSGLPINYSVVSGSATVSGANVTFTGLGSVVLAADQSGNGTYIAAPEVQQTLTVSQASQTIGSFPPIATRSYSPTPFSITPPTASSGLPVTVTVKSGNATISGDQITLTGVGAVTLAANQSGNTDYHPAAPVTTSFTVKKASQTITFPTIVGLTVGQSITLRATSSSGLTVTYRSSGPVKITGDTLTATGVGTATVVAAQAGNANYNAAQVYQNPVIGKGAQTITFPPISSPQSYPSSPITLTATASSGLPVTYRNTGPAKISGNVLTLIGVGTVSIGAYQNGNTNYASAPEAHATFTVVAAGSGG